MTDNPSDSSEENPPENSSEIEFDEDAFEDAIGSSPLDEDAVQMHELFLSFIKAGFLEHQALRLVALLIDQANAESIIFATHEDEEDDDEGEGEDV
jgi:hypothetical protein